MTLRYSSRRIDASLADALAGAGPVRLWAGARTVLHEGEAAVLEATGAGRCQAIAADARDVGIEHAGPGPGPLWLGGLAFDEQHVAKGPWEGFPAARFRLPRRQVVWDEGEVFETVLEGEGAGDSYRLGADSTARSSSLRRAPGVPHGASATGARPGGGTTAAGPGPATPGHEPFSPIDETSWAALVDDARREVHGGGLTKVVVARAEPLPAVDVRAHVLHLRKVDDGTVFLLEEGGAAFYGSTPETLVRLHGQEVTTHALAGSAAGNSNGALLLASGKDVLEHELVAAFVRERLVEAGVRHVRQGSRGLRSLRHVQHLETPVQGEAPEGAHVLDLAGFLHPTPAVCGTPRRRSMQWIRDHEGWPRGWYAGAVGWFDASGQGELSVALRCALQDGPARFAFAGAGIVAGSQPEAEWDETESKLALMREGP